MTSRCCDYGRCWRGRAAMMPGITVGSRSIAKWQTTSGSKPIWRWPPRCDQLPSTGGVVRGAAEGGAFHGIVGVGQRHTDRGLAVGDGHVLLSVDRHFDFIGGRL